MNFIDRILRERYKELELHEYGLGADFCSILLTPRFVTSRHVVALVFPSGSQHPRLVAKVPRQPGDDGGIRREAAVLRELEVLAPGCAPVIPRVVGLIEEDGRCILVETALAGTPLDPSRVEADLEGAVAAGLDFVGCMPLTRHGADNGGWYRRAVARPLEDLIDVVSPAPGVAELVARTHELLLPLQDQELPAVFEHADLSHPNILQRPDSRLQVLDWERSSAHGMPGQDFIFYLQYLRESAERAFKRLEQLRAFDHAFADGGWARAPLADHLEQRGIDPALIPALVVAAWARSAATLAERLGTGGARGDPAVVLKTLLDDRDFWLWRHAVEASASL